MLSMDNRSTFDRGKHQVRLIQVYYIFEEILDEYDEVLEVTCKCIIIEIKEVEMYPQTLLNVLKRLLFPQ